MDRIPVRRVTAGVLLVWIGVMMVVEEPTGLASLGAGAIILLAAVSLRAMGRSAGFLMWASGLLLIGLGINDLNGDDKGIPLFAVGLIAFGSLIVMRAFGRKRPRGVEITINGNRIHHRPRS